VRWKPDGEIQEQRPSNKPGIHECLPSSIGRSEALVGRHASALVDQHVIREFHGLAVDGQRVRSDLDRYVAPCDRARARGNDYPLATIILRKVRAQAWAERDLRSRVRIGERQPQSPQSALADGPRAKAGSEKIASQAARTAIKRLEGCRQEAECWSWRIDLIGFSRAEQTLIHVPVPLVAVPNIRLSGSSVPSPSPTTHCIGVLLSIC